MTAPRDVIPPRKKMRFCWYCGDELGEIEDRYYDRMDICGRGECWREANAALRSEREEAHRQLDEDRGWE